MYSIKFNYNGEVRRAQVSVEDGAQIISFDNVAAVARNLFMIEKPIKLQWTDDEGDTICCTTDVELAEAIRVMSSENKKAFKFDVVVLGASTSTTPSIAAEVQSPPQKALSSPPGALSGIDKGFSLAQPAAANTAAASEPSQQQVHLGVTCDGCGMDPIVGIRFRCTVRHNYDLCATCEAQDTTGLPMIKIYNAQDTTGQPAFHGHPFHQEGHGGGRGRFGRGGGRGAGGPHGRGPFGAGPAGVPVSPMGVPPSGFVPPIGPGPTRFGPPQCPQVPPGFGPPAAPYVHPWHQHAGRFANKESESANATGSTEWARGVRAGSVASSSSATADANVKTWQKKWNQYQQNALQQPEQQQQENPWEQQSLNQAQSPVAEPCANATATAVATPLPPMAAAVTSCILSRKFEALAKGFCNQLMGGKQITEEDDVNQQLLDEALKQSLIELGSKTQQVNAAGATTGKPVADGREGATTEAGHCSALFGGHIDPKDAELVPKGHVDMANWLPNICEALCPLKAAAKAAGLIGCMQAAQTQCQEHLNQQHAQMQQMHTQAVANAHYIDALAHHSNAITAMAANVSGLKATAPAFTPGGTSSLASSTSSLSSSVTSSQQLPAQANNKPASGQQPAAAPSGKLMARFVKDVTFPDGTHVQPKSALLKTWRIRNDGQIPWPENVNLVCSGGDFLTPQDLAVPVGVVSPNEETEVTVKINVPEATGRHVAYFRLRVGKDGPHFGQRMWIDIRVTEEESEWQVVSGILTAPMSLTSSTSSVKGVVTKEPSHSVNSSAASVVITDDVEATTSTEQTPEIECSGVAESSANETPVVSSPWEKELSVLGDMGFNPEQGYNEAELVSLLTEISVEPVSAHPEWNGVPKADGMQRVVAVLLSKSQQNVRVTGGTA
jgi:hypothetical protein